MHCLFRSKPEHKKERGNVLFIIMIAVALFAALAYTVTGSTRSSGGDASKEQTQLDGTEIIQYATTLRSAILRMKLSNGCTDQQISFETPLLSNYINPNAPADGTCHVFKPQGGNIPYQRPPKGASKIDASYFFGGTQNIASLEFRWNSTLESATETFDLLLILEDIDEKLCTEIQTKLNGTSIPSTSVYLYTSSKFVGSYSWGTGGIGGVGCTKATLGGPTQVNKFHFVFPLIIR